MKRSTRSGRDRQPPHPGALLCEEMLPAIGWPVAWVAKALGVTTQHVYRLLAEKTRVSPEMALRLGKFCGNGPDPWLAMQQAYDLWHAERATRKAIERISRARTMLEILRDEYPGDEAWKKYVDCFRPDWEARQDQAQLREKLPEDLAIVLSWHFGDRAWRRHTQPVPTLGGKTPQSVHSGPSGETILRTCIMRIPV